MRREVLRKALFLCAITIITSGCALVIPAGKKEVPETRHEAEEENLPDMTPEEREIMTDTFGEDERARFEDGSLFSYHKEALSQLREGASYLDNRYPGHDFHCTSLSPASAFRPWAEVYFRDGDSEEFLVKVIAQKKGGEFTGAYKCEDLFYGQLLGIEYDAALEKLFSDEGYKVRIHANFIYTMGEEFPANASVDDLLKAGSCPQTAFYVSESVEDETLADSLKAVMEKNNIDGDCWIYFAGRDVLNADIQELVNQKADMPYIVFHVREE